MKNKISKVGEIAWLLGIVFCALGVCLTVKSDFGVSMIIAPGYVLYLKLSQFFPWLTLGMSQYLVQGSLIVALTILMRRFKLKYLLCFLTAVIHGIFVDLWNIILKSILCTGLAGRILCFLFGTIITALAIALMLRTYLPQEVHELVVKEISLKFSKSVNRIKWIYDISFLAAGIILMLSLFGKFSFEMIGIGTVVMTFLNTPLITMWGKLLDKFFSFTPISNKFYDKFEKIMD